jgi:RNA polymerase subunit RPABC4/transcription elongation factor Spt4
MRVCPKCSIEYDDGKKFCRKCGNFLLTEEGSTFEFPIVESSESEKKEGKPFCQRCQAFYPKGKYCRKCGSLLVQGIPPRGPDAHPLLPRPSRLISAGVAILLIVIGGYFLWQRSSQTGKPIQPPQHDLPPATEPEEAEKIKSLFETIKEANLQKNIDLFMSCYSKNFKDKRMKRLDTLENWNNFQYLELSYELKEQRVSGNTADVKVEWLMKVTLRETQETEVSRTLLDVTLKREEDRWKIKEIKPVS